ncbi:MAG: hypothetical protein HC872_03525 [Gammaproteobacteria bacterium]|nr:hypothetical protein [Gammaproteobacteria bacterium]
MRESLQLDVALYSDRLSRDHGILQVFDGDPELGAQLVASRAVQGLAGDEATIEQIDWRPARPGERVLYVRYIGAGAQSPKALQVPVSIQP